MIYLMLQKNGLGNQMFSYAYARYLMELYQCGIAINPYEFYDGKEIEYIDERNISLQHFQLNESVIYLDEQGQMKCNRNFKWRYRFSCGLFNFIKSKFTHDDMRGEEPYIHRSRHGVYLNYEPKAYYKTVKSPHKNIYVRGHYQDKRYFDGIKHILKEEFCVKTSPSKKNMEMLDKISKTNAVCVHIRRGDYLNPYWSFLNVCDYDYYIQAMEYMMAHVENPTFFIFSNCHKDIEWIKENYHFEDLMKNDAMSIEYVDLDNPDYEELRLMCACKHFIISNSTFSWWAVYLSGNDSSIVCAPDRWDLKIEGDAGMNCDDWVIIQTRKKEYKRK